MSAVSFPRKHLKLVAAIALTALVAGLGTAAFKRKVESFEPLGFTAELAGGQWLVRAVDRPAVGVREGDAILSVGGGDSLPRSEATLRAALHDSERTELLVMRPAGLESVSYDRPPLELDLPYLVLSLVALVYLLVGLFTLLRRSQEPAGLFFLWCLSSAALYLLSPPIEARDAIDRGVFLVDQLARLLVPALTLHLLLVFPRRLRPGRQLGAVSLAYLPAAALLVIHADLILANGRFLAGSPTEAKLDALAKLDLAALVVLSLAGAGVLAWRLRRDVAWEARRQAQWVMAGVVGGYVPFLALYVVPRLLDLERADWLTLPAVLALGLVPLGFAYAILKYRLWDIGSILRDVVANGLTVLLGIFGFVVIEQLVSRSVGPNLGTMRSLLAFIAGLGIAGVLVPTRSVIVSRLDRLRYGNRVAKRRALEQLGAELVHERDLDRLCRQLVHHLEAGLGVAQANILLVEPGGLVPVHPEAGLPRVFAARAFADGFWTQDVSRLTGVPLKVVPDRDQQLYAAGYRYLFPMTVRSQPVGIVAVGNRADGTPLTGDDVGLARGLLNQAALAVENAHLLDEVQRQLREMTRLEASAKGILESSPAGIAVLDAAGRVAQANHAFAAIVGMPRSELVGRPVSELLPVSPLPDIGQGMVEVGWCDQAGAEHYLQIALAPHHGELAGQAAEVVIAVQDISERRRMEASLQEKERLSSLGLLAAGVAHEVNTPLTGISSYAQMLIADTPEGHPNRRMLEKMERQTFRASQIVNNLLAFARHRGEPMRCLDLGGVVAECVDSASARAADAGVRLEMAESPLGALVLGHEGELTQVVTNLLGNALDAMERQDPAAPRLLTVSLGVGGESVELRVTDTGPGIPEDRLRRIFEPFFSSKLGSGGTGLGLTICHNIVRRHGGELEAINQPGRGCAFVVRLPRHREDPTPPQRHSA